MTTVGTVMFLVGASMLYGDEWIFPFALCVVGATMAIIGAIRKGALRL